MFKVFKCSNSTSDYWRPLYSERIFSKGYTRAVPIYDFILVFFFMALWVLATFVLRVGEASYDYEAKSYSNIFYSFFVGY